MESYPSLELPSEDVLLGTPEGRNLSPVRRFFCLLVTFDLLFTILLWIMCIVLVKGTSSITDALELEILQYSFKLRIFDIVMSAACRFTILLLFYAILQFHHWFPVALTTTATCSFLLVKVFIFDWAKFDNATYPVMLVLSSFILSWSEAWFFDFRVVPQERQAAIFHFRQTSLGANALSAGSQGVIPWLGQTVSQIARNAPISQSYPESVANFYSPLESPIPSDGENENSETESMERKSKLSKNAVTDSPDFKMWVQQGPLIAQELLHRIRASGWVLEKSSDNGDNVFSQKAHRKIYMISGTLPISASNIVFELFQNFETMPNWNPAVSHCQILQKLDAITDVSYQVSKEGAGGAVSPRDFVTLRHHKINEDGTHVLAWVSVKHAEKPKQSKITRGTNGVGGWVLTPHHDDPTLTEFQWLLDIDLQLQSWIPKRIVDTAVISASLDTVKCLRNKITFSADQVEIKVERDSTSNSNKTINQNN